MKVIGNSYDAASGEKRPRAWAGPAVAEAESDVRGIGVHSTEDGPSLEALGDVLSLFSDPGSFRDRLEYVSQVLRRIAHAWSRPSLPDPDWMLGVLQELTKNAVVPPGCEQVQEVLMSAIGRYREASECSHKAKLEARISGCQLSWDYVREGDALIAQATGMLDDE
jgi:hypothetical protein